MNRSLIVILGALALCAGLFFGSYALCRQICHTSMSRPTDSLDWLRQEFHLTDAEMVRVRGLHEGYLPKCAAMCKLIADKKQEIAVSLTGATNVTELTQRQLGELASLRAQCQSQMIQHFLEVSQAMPPDQGKRYFAEMKRITLGEHEQVEKSMSESPGMQHGH